MKSLESVRDFGGIDADRDSLLDSCFEDHEAYKSLVSLDKFVILGRKGSGKTAIFRKLKKAGGANGVCSAGYTFVSYPWPHHDQQITLGAPQSEVYLQSWLYFILLALAKLIVADGAFAFGADESFAKLKAFLRDNYGTDDPDIVTFFAPGRELRIKNTLGFDVKFLRAGTEMERIPISEFPRYAADVNAALLRHIVSAAAPSHTYHIAFDELDRNFELDKEAYTLRLIGLILASRQLNYEARQADRRICASVFLRTDIFDLLNFEDKNKITKHDVARIEWDDDGESHTLRELMERRFSEVLRSNANDSISWNRVFSGREMSSSQQQYRFILDRTCLRPRDMIQYCNDVLLAYKKRLAGKDPTVKGADIERLDSVDILEARKSYSKYFRDEIKDEIFRHVPDWEKYLELLKTIGVVQFSLKDFSEAYIKRRRELEINVPPIDILRSLFKFSILGYRKTGGRRGGSDWVFSYKSPSEAVFDETASQYRVHYGLMENLNLKRYSQEKSGKKRVRRNPMEGHPDLFGKSKPSQRRRRRRKGASRQ